jgi:hypothetical protein
LTVGPEIRFVAIYPGVDGWQRLFLDNRALSPTGNSRLGLGQALGREWQQATMRHIANIID